ncbi:RDD family protein [Candidatus Haliotispira prima]|uniref:RDD family protein n=1 Tax=Candidatus Haliotispira prima TaxID=3034016 RepID=A0ABY8MMG3_9SPIO|nr:RDD family protein [Candidatus Haliotispira prima]
MRQKKIFASDDQEYIGFWPRFKAGLIDNIIIMVTTLLTLMAFYGPSYWQDEISPPAGSLDSWLSSAFSSAFSFVFITLFWIWKQATPGKMAVSIKIIDTKTGKAPSPARCIGRCLAYIISFLPVGLGFLWIAFDDRKRGWHDILSGTAVVRSGKR